MAEPAHGDKRNEESDEEIVRVRLTQDFINVEFDFRAPSDIDLQALIRLFQQLFYTNAPQMDLTTVADYVINLSQNNGIGTVVKVDDMEQIHDPYAVASAVTIGEPGAAPAADLLRNYLVKHLTGSASGRPLLELLQGASANKPLLWFLHERMVNLPAQLFPPLLTMLYEEYEEGRQEVSPPAPAPTHMLVFSRAFSLDAVEEETGLAGARKRRAPTHAQGDAQSSRGKAAAQKQTPKLGDGLGSFHPEDEILAEFATHRFLFRFPPQPDAADSYEAPIFARIFALPYDKVPAAIERIRTEWPVP
ncbi:Mss4p nuclear export [Malassezia obtusa]|uniref:Mss4p nuclear export n=1 Tax=Malassezia obtusa TaxID=76774 RepID=A0AAF0DXT4_9BASI|nr:Mss4p nuclear export [Malassezia obtusa]